MNNHIWRHSLRISLFLIVVSFIFGLIMGRLSPLSGSTELSKLLKESELDTESFLIEQEFLRSLGDSGCSLGQTRVGELSHRIYETGKFLSSEGVKKELGEEEYSLLKRRYHLLQLRTYHLLRVLENECGGGDYHTILFYYGEDDELSQVQGRILDTFVEDYGYRVFPVQYNYSPELRFMELYYNVTTTPVLIIDFIQRIEGLTSGQATPQPH